MRNLTTCSPEAAVLSQEQRSSQNRDPTEHSGLLLLHDTSPCTWVPGTVAVHAAGRRSHWGCCLSPAPMGLCSGAIEQKPSCLFCQDCFSLSGQVTAVEGTRKGEDRSLRVQGHLRTTASPWSGSIKETNRPVVQVQLLTATEHDQA